MNIKINEIKESMWNETKESLELCADIGNFSSDLLHNEDIPRIIHLGKPVIPDSIFYKISKIPNNDSELYVTAIESIGIAAGLKLGLNERFSVIFSRCYGCLYFKRNVSSSSQYEQIYFSSKFIKKFSINYNWNVKDKRLKKFIKIMFDKIFEWSMDSNKYNKDIAKFIKST